MATSDRALLFDAGNTLLFPRTERILQVLAGLGYPAGARDLAEAERAAKHSLDDWLWPQIRARRLPPRADRPYWDHYLAALMNGIGVREAARNQVRERLIAAFSDIHLWSRVEPKTPDFLRSLRGGGYRLGVISNSNGLIEEQLRRVGLAQHFDFILDSAVVGVEKPHPEIFRMAIERASVQPDEAVYVGDIHSIDVGGAELAGLRGILLDRVEAYDGVGCPRITTLSELERVLHEKRE